MTSPVGSIRVEVEAEFDDDSFERSLRAAVADTMREVQRDLARNALQVAAELTGDLQAEVARGIDEAQRYANSHRIQVGFDVDGAGAVNQVRAVHDLMQAATGPIRQQVDIDVTRDAQQATTAPGNQQITWDIDLNIAAALAEFQAAQQTMRTQTTPIVIPIDVDGAGAIAQMALVRQDLETLTEPDLRQRVTLDVDQALNGPLTVDATPDFTGFAQRVDAELAALQQGNDWRITIPVDVDGGASLAQMAALRQQLEAQTQPPITQHVNVDIDRGILDRAAASSNSLLSSLRGLGGAAGGIAAVGAALTAIVGAAGAAAGAIGGVAIAGAALAPAFAAGIAAITVGMQGVKDAFDAAATAADNAPREAEAQARAVAAATQQVTAAERAVRDAKRDSLSIEEELTRARKDATEQLEDYHRSARRGVLDERQAARDLADAQRELAETNPFDGRAREEAVDRVLGAQLRLEEVQDRNADNAEKLADAERKGIEGSDQVAAVRERQAQAGERLTAAEAQLTQAQAALTDAQTAALPSTEKMNEALAKLSPNAQAFVLAARGLADEWTEVRKAVQDNLFAGLDTTLTNLADAVLPHLRDGMGAVATEFNLGAKKFAGFLQSAQGVAGLDAAFASTADLLRGMREGSDGFLAGISQMVQTARPFAEQIGRAFGGIGTALGDAFSQISESGALAGVLNGFTTALTGLGPLLRDLVTSFATMGAQVLPTLGPLFEALGRAIVAVAPALGEIGAVFANTLTAIMPGLSTFISALADALVPVLPVVQVLLQTLGDALAPLMPILAQIAITVGQALIGAVQALAPALGPLLTAFNSLLEAVAPIVPLVATLVSEIVQALAPALTVIFQALAPVISQFVEAFIPILEQMGPVLAEVAMIIGQALADALLALAPILPQLVQVWGQLLLAVTPLLPVIAQLIADLLPPLTQVLLAIVPVITQLGEILIWFVNFAVNTVLVPALNFLGPLVTGIFNGIADVVTWVFQTVIGGAITWLTDTAFPALGRGLDTVRGWFDSGVEGITKAWNGLMEAAAVPVRFIVNTVWNDGLRKAWNNVAEFLPGLEPMDPVVLGFRRGGAVWGAGSGTSDSIDARLSRGEHVVTAAEVLRAGGQNILYAIRDLVARGIPFTWDNGRLITQLGRDNLSAYGAAVRTEGIGNVSPEGLFDPLLRFRTGGAVLPWMHQLAAGHRFAKAQDGRPYQWAGPRWPGDSFDCSGLIGSTIAAILGLNPWQRYWATSSFAGYPSTGPQGLVKNLREGVGMLVGVTDDPGGPGGGHTAGELRGIPELGIPAARVESGGALGDVHYGRGTPVTDFASLYGLGIGANGFFQPSTGGSVGPTPEHQAGFVESRIRDVFTQITDPIRDGIVAAIGAPPPRWREIPPQVLSTLEGKAVDFLTGMVNGLGDLLPAAWEGAQSALSGVGAVVDALNPFRRQSGGPIPGAGTGDIVPALLEPGEFVMNRRATGVFGPILRAMNSAVPRFQTGGDVGTALLGAIGVGPIPVHVTNFAELASDTGGGAVPAAVQTGMEKAAPAFADATLGAASQVGQQVAGDIGTAVTDAITNPPPGGGQPVDPAQQTVQPSVADEQTHMMLDEQGRILSETKDLIERTSSSAEAVMAQQMQQVRDEVMRVAGLLGADVLIPTVQSAMDAAIGVLQGWLDAGFAQVRAGTDQTTRAVYESAGNDPAAAAVPFGAPGSAFDATAAISEAVVSVADSATQAFQQVAQDVANAALQQRPSRVGNSRGVLGQDIDGGTMVNTIVNLTGVVIEIEETLIDTLDEIKEFRGDLTGSFDESGRLVSDTAVLMQRNQSSFEKVMAEQNRINRELIKAVLRYLMTAVVIPIMTAILGAMIQLAVTAIGAAIGSIIPGVGTVIGAAIGAVVGAALAGAAAIFTSTLAIGAGAAIDSFDSGGLAVGKGLMVKDTALPERVLAPREVSSYDRLGVIADHLESSNIRRTTVHAPIHMHGQRTDPERVQDRLLSLMPR
jgi:phage-related protein